MAFEYTPGVLIGLAKRKWKDSKRVTEYTDEISKEENALFKDDAILLGMVLKLKEQEAKIIAHIDYKLKEARKQKEAQKPVETTDNVNITDLE
jgi:hypothetical protein